MIFKVITGSNVLPFNILVNTLELTSFNAFSDKIVKNINTKLCPFPVFGQKKTHKMAQSKIKPVYMYNALFMDIILWNIN